MIYLVLGGARSGKTRFSEQLMQNLAQLSDSTNTPSYIATSNPKWNQQDAEMQARVERHQNDRQAADIPWNNIEEPFALGEVLETLSGAKALVMIDCLTLWLLNIMEESCLVEQKQSLLKALKGFEGSLVMVSNEIGMGVVPMDKLSRQYVDELGWLHQEIAAIADKVTLMVAGIPVEVKA